MADQSPLDVLRDVLSKSYPVKPPGPTPEVAAKINGKMVPVPKVVVPTIKDPAGVRG